MEPKQGYLKSFEEACARKGVKPEDIIRNIDVAPEFMKNTVALPKLMFMIGVANEETHKRRLANYNDENEWKSEAWVRIAADQERPAGFGFDDTLTLTDGMSTYLGVRLQFLDDDYGMFAVGNWQEYQDFLLAWGADGEPVKGLEEVK